MDYALLIIEKLGLNPSEQLKKPIRGLNGITVYSLIDSLIKHDSVLEAAKALGYTDNPVKQCIRSTLHPVLGIETDSFLDTKGNRERWYTKLLRLIEHKKCPDCNEIKPFTQFGKNAGRTNNLSSTCLSCSLLRTKAKKYYIVERTPIWGDMEAVAGFYKNCPAGYHVDHIIPLKGNSVSGLHVINNLQYLRAEDNLKKSNTYTIE